MFLRCRQCLCEYALIKFVGLHNANEEECHRIAQVTKASYFLYLSLHYEELARPFISYKIAVKTIWGIYCNKTITISKE